MNLTTSQEKRLIRMAAFEHHTTGDFEGTYDDLIEAENSITPGQAWTEKEVEDFLNQHEHEINKAKGEIDRWLSGGQLP